MKSRAKNIFWGICFLAVGISILGDWFAWWDGFSFSELLFAASMAFCILEDAKVFQMIFSGAAIIIGLCLIFGKKTKPGSGGPNAASRPPESAYTACFSGEHVNLRGMELKNGTVISEDITLKLTAVFGGIDVFAPENANIKTAGSSFLGGCENKTVHIEGGPTVTIEYTCVFGEIEIK